MSDSGSSDNEQEDLETTDLSWMNVALLFPSWDGIPSCDGRQQIKVRCPMASGVSWVRATVNADEDEYSDDDDEVFGGSDGEPLPRALLEYDSDEDDNEYTSNQRVAFVPYENVLYVGYSGECIPPLHFRVVPPGGESDAKESKEPPLRTWRNDDGAIVSHGKPSGNGNFVDFDRFFCGRDLGEEAIPGSDGQCGPSNGPPCPSCLRFYRTKKLDVLRHRFPLVDKVALVAALRSKGGVYGDAVKYLRKFGVYETDPFLDEGPLRERSSVPADLQELCSKLGTFEPLANSRESSLGVAQAAATICVDGHRMIRAAQGTDKEIQGESFFCAMCSCEVPSEMGGSFRCQTCLLCEGCVQNKVVPGCPGLANGGPHHHHPLVLNLERQFDCCRCCDIESSDDCLTDPITWSCQSCEFDLCSVCMAQAPPKGFDRRLRMIDAGCIENDGSDSSEVSDKNEQDDDSSANKAVPFDVAAAERHVASWWEGQTNQMNWAEVVVGTGVVGMTDPLRHVRRAPGHGCQMLVESDSRLSAEASEALAHFRAAISVSRQEGMEDLTAAATDITHAENILQRAENLDGRSSRQALYDAVAAGHLDIAGTLLLSRNYAPECSLSGSNNSDQLPPADNADTGTTEGQEKNCWCGDPIDLTSSPDGSVGCLSGHAMHASCASDLLLSGGLCPTCRQPLFFSRVADSELKLSAEAADKEISLAKKNEEEQARREPKRRNPHGERVPLSVGDVVLVSADQDRCKDAQADPICGGWHEDMRGSCGLEGHVTELVDNDGGVVAARVCCNLRTATHTFVKIHRPSIGPNFSCKSCDCEGPSPQTGSQRCSLCNQCEHCCRRPGNRTCDTTFEWTWNVSLLHLVRSSCGLSPWLDNATKTAENHMTRLRAELRAVKAARARVQEDLGRIEPKEMRSSAPGSHNASIQPQSAAHFKLSSSASAALSAGSIYLSAADRQWAHHLLLLTQLWGDSKHANDKRAALCDLVRTGEIDSVARLIRRHNAESVAEEMRWTDAFAETGEYCIKSFARVDLRAFPDADSPKTGYVLEPKMRFRSKRECLDSTGNLWLQVAAPEVGPLQEKKAVAVKEFSDPNLLVGTRVCRGAEWCYGDQDGGEGNIGIIRAVTQSRVLVQWEADSSVEDYPTKQNNVLNFADNLLPLPQGWLCMTPGRFGSPLVATRARTSLRCFGCGDGLLPTEHAQEKCCTAEVKKVRKGDRLLVAATLEPVEVEMVTESQIFCTFPVVESGIGCKKGDGHETRTEAMTTNDLSASCNQPSGTKPGEDTANKEKEITEQSRKMGSSSDTVWFRPKDLVFPKKTSHYEDLGGENERRFVGGKLRTRRELALMVGGSKKVAKNAWHEAGPVRGLGAGSGVGTSAPEEEVGTTRFASCIRGHLLHARCLQGAMLAGRCCPARGCSEPLCVPRIKKINDETTCGRTDQGVVAEAEALKAVTELTGHAAEVAMRETECPRESGLGMTALGERELKMCPACCAGPLFNENCSDMQTHHGQCTTSLFGHAEEQCTEDGIFTASEEEIAQCMKNLTENKSVADVLPKCPKHDALIMFNGCMACGHLFTDISWEDEMPKFEPNAKELLELDIKKRKAARLLSAQVRREASLLQFERGTLRAIQGGTEYCQVIDAAIEPPPPPASFHTYNEDDDDESEF